ncbi:hypothetical protein IE322_14800 [Pseudomonas asiatica]|uniref:hypothetical protein n=1 Tax=Pseudomonas asiatica TaxID=2219225 RepID=UPI0017497545|nr:hypothetical protein [Pseudomonas asiatica]QOE06504.1 hypothetical protein IE322_14800 [Pseudomonas asiatica]
MIRKTAGWYISLGTKIFKIVPGNTSTVIVFTLLSQLSLLLTFFLPLKVIILLGSNGIPHYFPQSWHSLGHSRLVIALSIAATISYCIYFISEQVISFCAKRGAKIILERSQKIALFNNQDDVASRAYQQYVRSLAAIIFIAFSSIIFALKYPSILFLLATYTTAAYVLTSTIYKRSERIQLALDNSLGRLPSSLAGIGFLLAFILIVIDLITGLQSEKFLAVIALLLVRQVLQRLASIATNLVGLMQQRLQISALFFHGHVLLNERTNISKSLWQLLSPSNRAEWLQSSIRESLGTSEQITTTHWHQTGVHDVFAFDVQTRDQEAGTTSRYLVKIFNTNRRELALQEASLLTCKNAHLLPAPRMIAATTIGKLNCHIVEWRPGIRFTPKEIKVKVLDVASILMAIPPSAELISRFARSRPLLPQRLEDNVIERLRLAFDESDLTRLEMIDKFEEALPEIKGILQQLPLQIINPDVNVDTLQQLEDETLCVGHWGRWNLEPIGSGWSTHELDLKRLLHKLPITGKSRADLANVDAQHVVLCALLYAFERLLQRQQFLSAFELLPQILEKIEAPACATP